MDIVYVLIGFTCGYLCKKTKDYIDEVRMRMIFERMSDVEKEVLATKFINEKLKREETRHGDNQ
jgi:hypothetical protein